MTDYMATCVVCVNTQMCKMHIRCMHAITHGASRASSASLLEHHLLPYSIVTPSSLLLFYLDQRAVGSFPEETQTALIFFFRLACVTAYGHSLSLCVYGILTQQVVFPVLSCLCYPPTIKVCRRMSQWISCK